MTVYTYTATERRNNLGMAVGQGEAMKVINLCSTQEVAAAASASTISFGKIPSKARLLGCSRLYWDDLATSGSPTLDVGLFAVNGNVTSDDDAVNDGLAVSAVSTAMAGNVVVKDIANFGVPAYSLVSGQTTDPGGVLEVKGTIRDAATTQTGTVTLDLYYVID